MFLVGMAKASAVDVGNLFLSQYYAVLCQQPEMACKFYHDNSVVSRPEEDGSMSLTTTLAVSIFSWFNA